MSSLLAGTPNQLGSAAVLDYSDRIIEPETMARFLPEISGPPTIEQQIAAFALFLQSNQAPEAFQAGYSQLNNLKYKDRTHNGITEVVQFNRLRQRNIEDFMPETKTRKDCFLCPGKMADQEVGFWFGDRLVFGNLFPYLDDHLVILEPVHAPQQLESQLPAMLQLAQEAPGRFFTYNGPEVGATAPDHPHGQSGRKVRFPVLQNLARRHREGSDDKTVLDLDLDTDKVEIYIPEQIGRNMLVVRAFEPEDVLTGIERSLEFLSSIPDSGIIDINGGFTTIGGLLTGVIYPRTRFRHSKFYDNHGLKNTPAVSEFTGIWPLPVLEQFQTVTANTLHETLADVSMSADLLLQHAAKFAAKQS